MTVSTTAPASRHVLLRGVDERGFTFFTNYRSAKARELEADPRVALTVAWLDLHRTVRVTGVAERLPAAESDAYFASRPRGSRIGAWASLQSRPLGSYEELMARVQEYEARFTGEDIPRPPYWSGFRVVPRRIEFWQGRPSRLHERERFDRDPADAARWAVQNLYP
jgi:pyridoxamine 5'-phosphate oxidase